MIEIAHIINNASHNKYQKFEKKSISVKEAIK